MAKYYIGTSGWSYAHWIKRFYPANIKQSNWLNFYSKHFNSVEINMSFYRFPLPSMLSSWYKKTPKDFTFTLKANRLITHNKKLKNAGSLVKSFYSVASLLKEKLCCILFQLPPNLNKDAERLDKFIKTLPKKYDIVFEFRNESWFSPEIYDILKKNNAGLCIVSGLGLPKVLKATSDFSYFRFHGSERAYSSSYTEMQLKHWAKRIKHIQKNKATKIKRIYAYFNNDDNAYAVKNALLLKELLKV